MRLTKKTLMKWLGKDFFDLLNQTDQRISKIENMTNVILEKESNSGIVYISDKEIIAKIFTGLKIYLDPRDLSVSPHLALDGIYEGNISNAWLSVVKPSDTVFDIGANFGYYGALAAQKTDKKKSKIIHFEANPTLIPYIKKTLGLNWLHEQSVVENLAISNKKGKVTLNILKDYIGSSSLHSVEHTKSYMENKMDLESQAKTEVQATSLDDYCNEKNIKNVDLIKLDIEGFEETAYSGMRKTIKKSPSITLFIEFTKQSYKDPRGFYELMKKDFGNVFVIEANGKIIQPKDTSYENIIDSSDDWVMPIFSKNKELGG